MMLQLDEPFAATLAEIALAGIHRAYPNKIGHLLHSDADVLPPQGLTPAFYGCFDWHSAVHSHWTLARLCQLFPTAGWATSVSKSLEASFHSVKIDGEIAYALPRPSFEMPYGVAWLLLLGAELQGNWAERLQALVSLRRGHFVTWLKRLPAPIRTGEHNQTAFAMGLIMDAARASGDTELITTIAAHAIRFHKGDTNAPLAYEPSAFDFLSPTLASADLMRRVLSPGDFVAWLDNLLPNGFGLNPVAVSDRSDGKLVHYDGLNLSRSWMLRNIAAALPSEHRHCIALNHAAKRHQAAGLVGLQSGDYAGRHWLPSFALMTLTVL